MSLEQSIDRLSTLIEQLIGQLEAGRTAKSGATPQPEAKAVKAEPAKSAIQDGDVTQIIRREDIAKVMAQAQANAEDVVSVLDYVKDVAPRFSLLVAKDRTAAIALMREFKADAKKLEEAILGADGKHDQAKMAAALVQINAKLGG